MGCNNIHVCVSSSTHSPFRNVHLLHALVPLVIYLSFCPILHVLAPIRQVILDVIHVEGLAELVPSLAVLCL